MTNRNNKRRQSNSKIGCYLSTNTKNITNKKNGNKISGKNCGVSDYNINILASPRRNKKNRNKIIDIPASPPYNWEKEFQEYLCVSEEESMLRNIPSSMTGTKTDDTVPRTLTRLIEDAVAFKTYLTTHMNSHQDNFLLNSVENVIHLVDTYCRLTPTSPFDWKRKQFPKSYKQSSQNACGDDSNYGDKGFKILDCGHVLPNFDAHGIGETVKAYVPRKYHNAVCSSHADALMVKCLKEFHELNVGQLDSVEKRTIELDHPVVTMISQYVVGSFNSTIHMHVKENEKNSLHDYEIMECKYKKSGKCYYFFLTIEGIEEGNIGVYEAECQCIPPFNVGYDLELHKVVLTERKPVGTKAMAISHFSCVRSLCEELKGVTDEKCSKLEKIISHLTRAGEEQGIAFSDLDCLLELHTVTTEGLYRELSLGIPLHFTLESNRTTHPGSWSEPSPYEEYPRLVRRKGLSPWSSGYDLLFFGDRKLVEDSEEEEEGSKKVMHRGQDSSSDESDDDDEI